MITIQVCGGEVIVFDPDQPEKESVVVKADEPVRGIGQFTLKDLKKAVKLFEKGEE